MKRFVLAAAIASILPAAAHAVCATQIESQAMNLHALKSSLMVAALSCGQQAEYNAFIQKNKPLYTTDSAQVRTYFSRAYGSGAEYQMNRFITKLANDASTSSMGQQSDAYCAAMKDSFRSISSLSRDGVKQLASGAQYASLHGIHTCDTGAGSAKLAMNSGPRSTK